MSIKKYFLDLFEIEEKKNLRANIWHFLILGIFIFLVNFIYFSLTMKGSLFFPLFMGGVMFAVYFLAVYIMYKIGGFSQYKKKQITR